MPPAFGEILPSGRTESGRSLTEECAQKRLLPTLPLRRSKAAARSTARSSGLDKRHFVSLDSTACGGALGPAESSPCSGTGGQTIFLTAIPGITIGDHQLRGQEVPEDCANASARDEVAGKVSKGDDGGALHMELYQETFPSGRSVVVRPVMQRPGRKADPEHDPAVWMDRVSARGFAISAASMLIRSNAEVAHAAVCTDGRALQFLSRKLRQDRNIVLAAVRQDGLALRYASVHLCGDYEVVLVAVGQNGLALSFAAEDMRANKQIVIAAVQQNRLALQFAGDALRLDPEMRALAGECFALEDLGANANGSVAAPLRYRKTGIENDGRWPNRTGWDKAAWLHGRAHLKQHFERSYK
mmetsp:Transcript_73540/g.137418  ORF Transcript_73540/g.137418 Transcript_73540/m.137418 type:complete len:357 (+) Transcript_73540:96-1166(+)